MSEQRQGSGNSFFGKKHSLETIQKIRENRRGKCLGIANPVFGGHKESTKRKVSETRVRTGVAAGSKNPNWRGGRPSGRGELWDEKYKVWRKCVFERDDYTCVDCKQVGGDLEADHIKPWAFFPELRYIVGNGATRCVKCHRKTFKRDAEYRKAFYGKGGQTL